MAKYTEMSIHNMNQEVKCSTQVYEICPKAIFHALVDPLGRAVYIAVL